MFLAKAVIDLRVPGTADVRSRSVPPVSESYRPSGITKAQVAQALYLTLAMAPPSSYVRRVSVRGGLELPYLRPAALPVGLRNCEGGG